jgi:thiol:disulfide interchange protein
MKIDSVVQIAIAKSAIVLLALSVIPLVVTGCSKAPETANTPEPEISQGATKQRVASSETENEPAHEPSLVNWVEEDKAIAESQSSGKPIFYEFSATWCGPCRALNEEVFNDKASADFINKNFVPVQYLGTQTRSSFYTPAAEKMQQKHGLQGIPSVVVVDPKTDKSTVTTGYGGKDEFIKFLSGTLKTQ